MFFFTVFNFTGCFRSLSELDSLRLTGEAGDKIRQVTERATLFRITSNAMINVSLTLSVFLFFYCVAVPDDAGSVGCFLSVQVDSV